LLGRLAAPPLNAREQKHFDHRVAKTESFLQRHFAKVTRSSQNLYNCVALEVTHDGVFAEKLRDEILAVAERDLAEVELRSGGFLVKLFRPNIFHYESATMLRRDLLLLGLCLLLLLLLQFALSAVAPHKHSALLCHFFASLRGGDDYCHEVVTSLLVKNSNN
jgi:hypothetical protein